MNDSLSYKTLAIVAVSLLATVLGHMYISDIGGLKNDVADLKEDTQELKILVHSLKSKSLAEVIYGER